VNCTLLAVVNVSSEQDQLWATTVIHTQCSPWNHL